MQKKLLAVLNHIRFNVELPLLAEKTDLSSIMDDIIEVLARIASPEMNWNPIYITNWETKKLLEEIDDKDFQDFLKEAVVFDLPYDVMEIETTYCRSCDHRYDGSFNSCYNCNSKNVVVQTGWKCEICGNLFENEDLAKECNEEH